MNTAVIKTMFKMDNMEYLCRTAGLEQNVNWLFSCTDFRKAPSSGKTMSRLAALGYRCLAPDQRGYSDGAFYYNIRYFFR